MTYIKQLKTNKWIKGIARPVAYIQFTPRELCLSHGIEFDYIEGNTGLGDEEVSLLQTHSGNPFGLIRYPQANRTDYTAILVDEKLDEATDLVNEIMCDLGLQSSDMLFFDQERYRLSPCKLIREDDLGNRIVVAKHDYYPDAFLQKEKLEQRGHKQSFSIELNTPNAIS